MFLKLEKKELREIASLIAGTVPDYMNYGKVRYTLTDDIDVVVEYRVFTEEYREDDYFNGTGAWVTTSAEVIIEELYLEGLEMEVDYDEWYLVEIAQNQMVA